MKSNKNKIIVFANQKGGVGKSTLCILLANYLTYWKKDVCIIDTDIQQSATLQREQDKQTFGDADGECAISGWLSFNRIRKNYQCIPKGKLK